MTSEEYYEPDSNLDIEAILIDNGMIQDLFYLKDLKQRKLFLEANIEQATVSEIAKHILQYNKEDSGIPVEDRKPILLYLSSDGGDVDAGFELIDIIMCSKTPVYTINLAYQYSMGFLIGLAGHKRFAMPNAKFLMHDGSIFVYNSGAKVEDQMAFQQKVSVRIKNYIISRSNVTPEEYDQNFHREWYMFAEDAKAKGFTDYIIGEDCSIEEII